MIEYLHPKGDCPGHAHTDQELLMSSRVTACASRLRTLLGLAAVAAVAPARTLVLPTLASCPMTAGEGAKP